ncbi:CBS domain-containing protein [Peribacillus deserti]|uniref:CBS domain-containing protein n=1 Tax=Peribacillus deserti TaxID=673318 RepID=A0ABS2QJS1_9BACI|nr:CBS domain-containing protein [Peribacillus deserti]MBM7693422.1 CBS domain-containing protein [Peribacillus deserti]
MKTVKDYMSSTVDYCTTLDNVFEVAVKMKDLDVGIIPILEDNRLVGVITDRDIVVRGVAEKHPGSTKVTDIMSSDLYTADPDMSIEEAAHMMAEQQIKRLPVVKDEKLVGIIALRDIAVHDETKSQAGFALSEISETQGNNMN